MCVVCSGRDVSVRDTTRVSRAAGARTYAQVQRRSAGHAHLVAVPHRRRRTSPETQHDLLATSCRLMGQTFRYWSVAPVPTRVNMQLN